MTTYILIDFLNKNILGVYTDRDAAVKMMRVFKAGGNDCYCQTMQVNNNIPAWAEKVLALNK